jgi:hypothetical protein
MKNELLQNCPTLRSNLNFTLKQLNNKQIFENKKK